MHRQTQWVQGVSKGGRGMQVDAERMSQPLLIQRSTHLDDARFCLNTLGHHGGEDTSHSYVRKRNNKLILFYTLKFNTDN